MFPEIKKLGTKDLEKFLALIRLFEQVFEMKDFKLPDEKHLKQLLDKDDFFVFVALADQTVIGGLTAYSLQQYYSEKPLVYLYDLAIGAEFQRQGIGKELIATLQKYSNEIGTEEIFVQAHEEDKHALDFYHSTGATAEKVVQFYYRKV